MANVFNLKRIVYAFGYSLAGLKALLCEESAFKQEVVLSLLLFPLAFYLGETRLEQLVLISSWLLVLIVEALNSAIEATVDLATTNRHPLAKRAKDIGSAAVLLSIVLAVVVWGLVIWGQH